MMKVHPISALLFKRRNDEQTYEYNARRKRLKAKEKEKLKGKLVWDSKTQGTYRREEK